MNAVASAPAGVLDVALQSAETAHFRAQDWFAVLRQQGWHTFQSLPMPTRDNEKWRFSAARTLSLDGYAPAPAPTPAKTRRANLGNGFAETPVYLGSDLAPGSEVPSPAIIEETFTTIVVYPGWKARVDDAGDYELVKA